MAFATAVWDQIKNITTDELCSALQRDGWAPDCKGGWSEDDLRRLNVIK